MQSSDYLLPEFGRVYEHQDEDLTSALWEAAGLSYRVLMIAMQGFSALAIPIWVMVVLILG